MSDRRVVYTIGHSNHSPDRFVELLHQQQIKFVVDVRSAPYSRFSPHFNCRALEALLERQGLNYVFAGEVLGGRPKNPDYYKTREVPTGKADYLNLVDYSAIAREGWFQRGVRRLLAYAEAGPTAIMCSEENPLACHRHHLIASSLLVSGADVLHIRKDGSLQSANPSIVQSGQENQSRAKQLNLGGTGA